VKELDYLLPYKKNIDWEALCALKEERESWWNRESSKRWLIENYPEYKIEKIDYDCDSISVEGSPQGAEDSIRLRACAEKLIPWKKGPFKLFENEIDSEWKSQLKWDRLAEHLPELKDKVILDIGCNNGYFLFRMASHKPRLAMGIDPVLPMQAQFDLIQNYTQNPSLKFELFGVEHLGIFKEVFDVIFYMGIIYHHRHPIQQLLDIREALKPGGTAFLETIGIPGEESYALFPEDRYARMGNVWFVPTMSCFINWAKKVKFIDIEVIADSDLNEDEQRKTQWCPEGYKSLKDSLDPEDQSLTIEGHPAPRRFLLKVKKKGGKLA
jgi:tRNA (mo5U34)-methyltransferase